MVASLAKRTQQTYTAAWKSYSTFCVTNDLAVWPVTEVKIVDFVTHAALRQLSHKTLTVYLAGLKYFSQIHGYQLEVGSMHILYHVMRGIRRTQGNTLTRAKRSPITVHHLHILLSYLNICYPNSDGKMLWCSFTMAFFGLLRSSEYTSPTSTTVTNTTLLVQDVSISIDGSRMFINLRGSKTDPFRQGTVIRLCKIQSALCPVHAASQFRKLHPTQQGPFLQFQNGSFLTRDRIASILQSAFPRENNINTHSFRIGGASAAASMGVQDTVIQILGRWSSDCFRQYIRITDRDMCLYQQLMANGLDSHRIWDADTLSSNFHL